MHLLCCLKCVKSGHVALIFECVSAVSTLKPRQKGRHFASEIFKYIFLNGNFWISNKISLKYVVLGLTDNMSTLLQIWWLDRTGDKPSSDPMIIQFTDAYLTPDLNELIYKLPHIGILQVVRTIHTTEMKTSTFWLNVHHWCHRKLAFWQLPVQLTTIISSKWRYLSFSAVLRCVVIFCFSLISYHFIRNIAISENKIIRATMMGEPINTWVHLKSISVFYVWRHE